MKEVNEIHAKLNGTTVQLQSCQSWAKSNAISLYALSHDVLEMIN
jgi:hypothetical protein